MPVKLNGSTSGSVTVQAPAVAGTNTLTLPAATGNLLSDQSIVPGSASVPTNGMYLPATNTLGFATNSTNAMLIDSSGNLLVGITSATTHTLQKASPSNYAAQVINTSATAPYGFQISFSGITGGAGSYFIVCADNANRFLVAGSGNVTNVNNSYGAISDVSLKENIADATPKLSDLMKVKIRNYNLKGTPQFKQIGVVAQELETVFPSMVETGDDGLKSVKYSVFVPMLVKAIQELSAEVEALKSKVGA